MSVLKLLPGSRIAIDRTPSPDQILASAKYFVSASNEIESTSAEILWEKNQAGFVETNSLSIWRQNMTREEYFSDISSRDVLKYTSFAKKRKLFRQPIEHVPVGMLFVYTKPSQAGWLNQLFFQKHLPEYGKSGRYSYVSTLVVEAKYRSLESSGLLVRAVCEDLLARQAREGNAWGAIVDFAKANHSLPRFIEFVWHGGTFGPDLPLKFKRLGKQCYYFVSAKRAPKVSGARVVTSVTDSHERNALWSYYDEFSLAPESSYPGHQRLSRPEFNKYLSDTSIDKIIVSGKRGDLVLMVTHDLTPLEHINDSFVESKTGAKLMRYLLGGGAYESEEAREQLLDGLGLLAREVRQKDGCTVVFDADEECTGITSAFSQAFGSSPEELDHQDYWLICPKEDSGQANG